MHAKKLVKWGVALTSTLVLGGVVGPVGGNLANTTSVVYAEEMQSRVAVHAGYYFDGELSFAAFDLEEFWIGPGENKTIAVPVVDGYVYEGKYLLSNGNGERLLQGSPSARYEDTVGSSFVDVILIYAPAEKPVEQPVETPAAQPVETPTEQPTEKPVKQPVSTPTEQPVEKPVETPAGQPTETPAEKPVETPVEQPISVAIIAISEADGPLSHYYVTINPGETKTVEAPKVDGYKLDQYAGPTYELTYDYALGLMNSGGSAWVQFWMIKDTAPETPVDQPVEQPAEVPVEQPAEQPVETPTDQPTEKPATTPTDQPVEKPVETPTEKPAEQPVETPTDQPTEKPTATSLLADNTASKTQTGATTDKKKVDNSTPSTNTVKPEEDSQATAKTLPKTGDSSSMLLVLGGLLSGLSGLGLVATSRKRD
ncbi:TPA: LPXTG cell wall anchor domain-containing protein [Streptococcus suis]